MNKIQSFFVLYLSYLNHNNAKNRIHNTPSPNLQTVQNILSSKNTRLFIILGCFFIANALIAEFMGVKIFSLERSLGASPVGWNIFGSVWNFDLSAGVLLWPVVFIMSDIINEYYGRKGVKFLSWMGAGLIGYAFFMYYFAINLMPASWWPQSQVSRGVADMNASFNGIFGQGLGIIIGSLSAFLLAQLLDVTIFHQIKMKTGEKNLWLRATGSTIFSQLIDTFVVTSIAFYFYPMLIPGNGEPWSIQQLLTVCAGGYLYKFTVAVLMTPIVYLVHNAIEKYLGEELAAEMKAKASLA